MRLLLNLIWLYLPGPRVLGHWLNGRRHDPGHGRQAVAPVPRPRRPAAHPGADHRREVAGQFARVDEPVVVQFGLLVGSCANHAACSLAENSLLAAWGLAASGTKRPYRAAGSRR